MSSLGQATRFMLVGVGGYVANLASFALLYDLGIAYLAASVTAYLVSNGLMYLGNRYFTFALGHAGFWCAYARYALVGAAVVALNTILLATLVETADVEPWLGQGISLAAITPVAFLLNKRWAFRLRPA